MDQKTTPILLMLLAVLLGYMAYTGAGISMVGIPSVSDTRAQVAAVKESLQALTAATDSARRELAKGSVDELRQRVEGYRGDLALLQHLVPERNEVPNLLDDISGRAKLRGVTLSQVVPMPVEPGPAPFDTHKYQLAVLGHYHQIGEFLTDIASLQRIIVPFGVSMVAANQSAARALGDTTGSLLEAKFQIRTYVKSSGGNRGAEAN